MNIILKDVDNMKQMIKIIRKVDMEKQYERILQLELDYELSTLYLAMQQNNEFDILKSKRRLKEIYEELEGLRAYA
jgi:hypothetical protein